MFSLHSWPEAIAHIDGDAFFASVMQAVHPSLRGKPVITGQERGIATAVSYEARARGVKRGMTMATIKQVCPECLWVESDYELFTLFSKRMFQIMRSFSPTVEEYSIDEGFVDLKGLRSMYRCSYADIALQIKERLEKVMNITVTVGLSITKSLAKIASSVRKPSGFTVIPGKDIERFLVSCKLEDIWGIGPQTCAFLKKRFRLTSALSYAQLSKEEVHNSLSKPYHEIWEELRGKKIYELHTGEKTTYASISKTKTVTPPTSDKELLWARLLENIEEAFEKARRYKYVAGGIFLFLKTQAFTFHSKKILFPQKTNRPLLFHQLLHKEFDLLYQKECLYRATGCTIFDLTEQEYIQQSLFIDQDKERKLDRVYEVMRGKVDFGTALYLKRAKEKDPSHKRFSIPLLSLQDK